MNEPPPAQQTSWYKFGVAARFIFLVVFVFCLFLQSNCKKFQDDLPKSRQINDTETAKKTSPDPETNHLSSPDTQMTSLVGSNHNEPLAPNPGLITETLSRPQTDTAPPLPTDEDPDEVLLRAVRLVYCAQKRGNQEAVFRIWETFGYTSASWAKTIQAAHERAISQKDGFGARWAELRKVPCP